MALLSIIADVQIHSNLPCTQQLIILDYGYISPLFHRLHQMQGGSTYPRCKCPQSINLQQGLINFSFDLHE